MTGALTVGVLPATPSIAAPAAPAAPATPGLPSPTASTPTGPQAETSSAAEAPDAPSALAAAKRTGHAVEATNLRSETSQTFANPTGTLTFKQSLTPTRVRKGNRWVPLDTRLMMRADGFVTPIAAAADIAISGGGAGVPLARVRHAGHEIALSWPGKLPRPRLQGSTAIYSEVYPGVDLKVEATALGFSEVVVVKTRAAATSGKLARVRFKLATKGVTAKAAADGHIEARDHANNLVFTAPTPLMWDGRGDVDAGQGGAIGPLAMRNSSSAPPSSASKAMKVSVSKDELAVVPDAGMLADPATPLPISIDPSFSAYKADNAWTTVWSKYPDSRFWQNDHTSDDAGAKGAAKVGRTRDCDGCGDYTVHTFFRMNTAPVNGKHILDAKFQINQKWSWFCDSNVNAGSRKAGLWLTNGISPSTTWRNQPGLDGAVVTADAAHAYNRSNGCAPPGQVEFNVTGFVQQAAAGGWSDLTFGMRGINDGDVNYWKRYDPNPVIAITYNSYPNAPGGLSAQGKGCATGAARPYVTTTTPAIAANISDPDAEQQGLNAHFYWWTLGGQRNDNEHLTRAPVGNPAPTNVTIPAGRLVDGQTYAYQALVHDGYDWSQGSQVCEFTVDATPPNAPRAVMSTDYPSDGSFHGEVGRAGVFSLTPPAAGLDDVDSYVCSVGLNPRPEDGLTVPANGPGKSAQVTLTPPVDGNVTLRVWSKDKAGNLSDPAHPAEYGFRVRIGSAPAARWSFDRFHEADLSDATGHGNTAAAYGGLVPGAASARSDADWASSFDGARTYAGTKAPLATRDVVTEAPATVRTDSNFSVAAWVKLPDDRTPGEQAVVGQDGDRTSAYFLGYNGDSDRWVFAVAGADMDNAALARTTSDAAAKRNTWVHLTGVYDATTHKARLYVNGTAQAAVATVAGGFNATGPVTLGRRKWNGSQLGYFRGDVADVAVYARVLGGAELPALVKPLPPKLETYGAVAVAGRPFNMSIEGAEHTDVAELRYSVGSAALDQSVKVEGIPWERIDFTPKEEGDLLIAAAAVDSAGRRGDVAGIYLHVGPRPRLSGRVTDAATGAVLAGANVRLTGTDTTVTTGPDGTYVFDDIGPYRYTVSASFGYVCGGQFGTTEVDVNGATTADLTLAVQADAFGYVCAASTQPFVPADATVLSLTGDDTNTQVTLPFPMTYYGRTYTTAWVDVNGLMWLEPPPSWWGVPSSNENAVIPSPHNSRYGFVAPYWADLVVDGSASVRTSALESAAGRQFVVEWRNVALASDRSKRVTFEVVLTDDGTVQFNYAGLDNDTERGAVASVGIDSPFGTTGVQYGFKRPALADNRAVSFRYPTNPHQIEGFTLSGKVTTAATGAPAAGVRVAVVDYETIGSTTTAADGTYTLAGLAADYWGYDVVATDDQPCGLRARVHDIQMVHDTIADLAVRPQTDEFGYTCTVGNQPFVRVDDRMTPVRIDDDILVRLPFPVTIYGRPVQALWQFEGTLQTAAPPGEDPVAPGPYTTWISPLDGWVTFDAASSVRAGMTGVAPQRKIVIEWRNVEVAASAPDHDSFRVSFEAIFGEDGSITFNYADLSPNGEWIDAFQPPRTVEIGLRDDFRSQLDYLEDGRTIRNDTAVTFRPPPSQ